MIRMLIVDDEYYIRLGIRSAIDWQSIGIEIVGEAEDGEQGLELALELKPDLILMDIRMPFMDGLELMEKISEEHLDCGIIVLSGYDEFEYAQRAIKYGVLDYLLKPIDKQKLKETVQNASAAVRKRRSVQHYQNLVDQEQTSIRTQFLRDLIFGRINDDDEIASRSKALDLPLLDSPCQAIFIKLDDYSILERQLSADALRNLRAVITSHLSEHFLLGRSFMGMLADVSPEEWAVILSHVNTVSQEEREKELHENMNGFFSDLEESVNHTVSVSISPVCSCAGGLTDICQTARLANKKYLPCTNSVVWPGADQADGIRPEVQEALNFIRIHYSEDITIQQIADALYLSPYYLMHIFKNDVGKTFNTFLTEYRMEMAKELLKKPGCRIYEIAAQVGYSDVKYFNKLFKKHTDLTPSEYTKIKV